MSTRLDNAMISTTLVRIFFSAPTGRLATPIRIDGLLPMNYLRSAGGGSGAAQWPRGAARNFGQTRGQPGAGALMVSPLFQVPWDMGLRRRQLRVAPHGGRGTATAPPIRSGWGGAR